MNPSPDPSPEALGLPHREPFLFIDTVTALDPGKSAGGTKTFSPQEPFFRGHFPGEPLVPGVILTEALAQIAGLAVARPGLRLAAIRAMKFPDAARPGETITLHAERQGGVGGLHQFAVRASVAGRTVAEGMVILGAAAPEGGENQAT